MIRMMKQFWKDEEGVTAIEYGLIAALIAMVIVGAVISAGGSLNTLWQEISDQLSGAAAGIGGGGGGDG
ncbi:MAG: Flp family type IVb pilin [Pseudomonadota bacterium]|nr:Flp family type IVb pilin [Pseudomonadota bacterium]